MRRDSRASRGAGERAEQAGGVPFKSDVPVVLDAHTMMDGHGPGHDHDRVDKSESSSADRLIAALR